MLVLEDGFSVEALPSRWGPVLEDRVVAIARACPAEGSSVHHNLPAEVDALPAIGALHAFALISGQIFGSDLDADILKLKQIVFRHLRVGQHLLLILAFDLGMKTPRHLFGRFSGRNPDRATAL